MRGGSRIDSVCESLSLRRRLLKRGAPPTADLDRPGVGRQSDISRIHGGKDVAVRLMRQGYAHRPLRACHPPGRRNRSRLDLDLAKALVMTR